MDVLQGAGFMVLEAASGGDAIAMLDRLDQLDLLLTDLRMPGRHSGVDVALHARTRFPQVPVIVTTGSVEDSLTRLRQLAPLRPCWKNLTGSRA